ncbi:hypothetical protein [Flexistipes sinusarabici]|uniref:hypothetical protein n=1 Tax=Flexistipes sinusarabici TaxID=2352 RepID=UPI0026E9DE2B|nr:hypothetical protein [Flexistipes sinusarabici]
MSGMEHFDIILKKHPKEIKQNVEADDFTGKIHFATKPFFIRAINKLSRTTIGKNIIK